MSVWLTIPSKRHPDEIRPLLDKWRERGYKIALWRDEDYSNALGRLDPEYILCNRDYPGYAAACNALIRYVMEAENEAEWFICAGDDTEPDPNRCADDIARQCVYHFSEVGKAYRDEAQGGGRPNLRGLEWKSTWGVMQPTGDRWHEGVGGFANAPIDRVAGSAWYGREYCRRMYGGDGPLFKGYQHMYVDEEAQEVALKMGVFWQRRDLVQRHNHWGRAATDKGLVTNPVIPAHLEKWNTSAHWQEAKALFTSRKRAGFPGHEPIP